VVSEITNEVVGEYFLIVRGAKGQAVANRQLSRKRLVYPEMHDITARHGRGIGLIVDHERNLNRFRWAGNSHPGQSPLKRSENAARFARHPLREAYTRIGRNCSGQNEQPAE
jgi:hypothetical protein